MSDWEKIKLLFQKVIELSPEEREAFLEEHCNNDPELRKEIESLIKSHGKSGGLLEITTIQSGELDSQQDSSDSFTGMSIGKYKVEKKIGDGGMAVVYSAVRADEHFTRRVAVKFIKRGMDTEEIIKRFNIEQQTLAGLNHPFIAKIIDGGTTDKGLPYFVMELIEGEPINKYCLNKNLSIKEKLVLFQKVCSAIQYAHQNLVVHRDIKPGNIFVTSERIPKLLDFGIAKLLGPSEGQTNLTRTGFKLMTLEYASPEQFRGDQITTSTDVYSLGVVLYELLTGSYPYKFNNTFPYEVERVICTTEPQKPSTAIRSLYEDKNHKDINAQSLKPSSGFNSKEYKKNKRKLSGDIDNIVLKAMQKEPARRYSSVEQFSEDINKHLNGLPIIARKNSIGYLSKKYYERHRVGVIAVLIIFLLIISGGIGIIYQSRVAANERDKAILEAKKSERINTFLQDILAAPNPQVDGKDVKVVDVLKNASEKINKELSDDPEIKADAMYTIGTTYMGLGLYNDAERYLKNSLDISEKIFNPNDPQIAKVMEQLAFNYQKKSNFSKADSLYRKALKIFSLKGGNISSDEAKALSDYGSSLYNQGKYEGAKKYQTEALNTYRKIYGNNDPHVLKSLNDLETIAGDTGDWNTAAKYSKEVLNFFLKTDGKESVNYSVALSNYATILEVQGRLTEAIEDQREAVEIKKRVEGKNHPDAMFAQITLADELTKHGDYVEAAGLSKEAMESLDKSLPHINVLTAYSRVIYASALIKLKDFKKALPYVNDALQIRKKLYPPGHWLITATKILLGACLAGLKQYIRAEQILTYCYSKMDKNDEGKKYLRILTLQNLVKSYKATGNKKTEQKYESDLAQEKNKL